MTTLSSNTKRLRIGYIHVRALSLWWQRHDRRHRLAWRLGNALAALLILLGVAIPLLQELYQTNRYQLAASSIKLVGNTSNSLAKLLTYDAQQQQYQFNKNGVTESSLPAKLQKFTTGTPANTHDATYSLDIPQNLSRGVTYHDVNSQLSFSLQPEFHALAGKQVDGHLVFPLDGGNQAIYTLKGNGLKEDIVVPQVTSDTMTFSYKLDLPNTLEAKIIPDSNGAIGIYSADPALFGNISYGSSADAARVQKARVSSPKTYLVFGLPAPTIKTADNQALGQAGARFVLNGNQLNVVAENLQGLRGPVSIDPSVVVTSTNDFQTNGNLEGNIDFATSDQITRSALTGGSVAGTGWTNSTNNLNTALYGQATVTYNGYMYSLGGEDSGSIARAYVQYAPINSGGTLGAWHYTHNSIQDSSFVSGFTTPRFGLSAVAYNGYMYIMGGTANNSTGLIDVQYAPINANGTIGTWSFTSSLGTALLRQGAAAYNGYMYVYGGTTDTVNANNAVQYAQINADGTIGGWHYTHNSTDDSTTSSSSLPGTGRYSFASAVYNGYLYIMGGRDSGSIYGSVLYAPLNANGTIGSWTTGSSFTTARQLLSGFAYNGYLYILGGGAYLSDVQYAPIRANGSIGSWVATSSFATARNALTSVAYNGYLYILGGYSGVATSNIQYAKIDPAGQTQAWATDSTHAISAARALTCSVAYNSFLYAIGGSTNDTGTLNVATVQMSAISNSGTLGTWSAATSLSPARSAAGCAANNNFLYLVGGYTGSAVADGVVQYISISPSNGTLGASWSSTTHTLANDLSVTTVNPGVFISGGYIYSVGGDNSGGSGTHTGVYYAPLSSSGDITSAWAATGSLTGNYTGRAFAMAGNYLYAFGGSNGTSVQSGVEYAQLQSNGTVGSWSSSGIASLPAGVSNARGATINGCIYSVGGKNSSTSVNTVYYACPNSDGTISSWHTATNLVTALSDMGIATAGGIIFGVGGWTTTVTGNIAYAAVNNGGSGTTATTTWVNNGTDLTGASPSSAGVAYGQFFAANGYLYLVGGYDGTTTRSQVYSAPINSDGSVGSWTEQTATPMNTPRYQFALAVSNGYVYAFAGENGATLLNSYEYAKIGTGGTLSTTWTQPGAVTDTTGSAITTRILPDAAGYGNYVYITGGQNGGTRYNDVYGASVNTSTGALTWLTGTALNSFATTRSGHKAFAYNGYLYVVGGRNGTPYLNDVQYASINTANGTLGNWTNTTPLQQTRGFFSLSTANGFVYIMGGTNAVGGLNDVEDAPILANGALGVWERSAGNFNNGARSNTQSTIYNGVLYFGGGQTSSGPTYLSDLQYMPLNNISRIGHYSKFVDFSVAVSVNSVTYTSSGSATTANPSPLQVRAAGSSLVSFGSAMAASLVGQTAASCQQLGISDTRYLWLNVTFDDSQSAVFAADATASSISDITITYTPVHAPPNMRLRNGQTLQTGNLTGLDTCGV